MTTAIICQPQHYVFHPDNATGRTMDPVNNVTPMRKSKEEKKVFRKQLKSSHTLLKHEGIRTAQQPTKSLVVANGGLGNGVSREELCAALNEMGEVETLLMPPHKPYAFVTYRSQESAQKAHFHLNGGKLMCGENGVTLYLSFIDSVSHEEESVFAPLPDGLLLVEDFVSAEEEVQLMAAIDWSSSNDEVIAQKALKHRRVKHFGFEFRYDNNNVDKDEPLPAGLPDVCLPLLERCIKDGYIDIMPDQLTVNQYQSGQGIPPHVDTHSAFEDTLLSLSLGARTVMEFRHPDGRVVPVVLPGRSLLVMKGESRYLWTHGITPRKFDMVPVCDLKSSTHSGHDLETNGSLTLSKRGTRTSFTFRKIRPEPCRCAFPSACDSQGPPAPLPPSPPALPSCPSDAARLEQEFVHQVYDAIAYHFSSTRHSPWPRVCHFLSTLTPGSVLVDVGCGNGKYLGVNPEITAVGCDRSSALVQICADRGFNAFVSDALSVPLRTASCDACISIAVIHHLSTQERRLAAVRELVRLLKPGGRALIYVWAFEQEHNKQKSKYLKDHNGKQNLIKNTSEGSQEPCEYPSKCSDGACTPTDYMPVTDGKLSVHTNRTAFNTQDLLVPWHLKEGKRQEEKVSEDTGKNKRKSNKASVNSCLSSSESPQSDSSPSVDCSLSRSGTNTSKTTHSLGSNPLSSDGNTHPSKLETSPAPVFHRFYHVFQQGELEQLCAQVSQVKVLRSYHDQGNWCVILLKEELH
ncbi:alkylated DNA repair protein alkB homolog 8 isoform X2 [Gouania willdenowi]|nr:alkylated DNA repair protein alkB homolog 8 isoform X2 [Gouania willdenowi]